MDLAPRAHLAWFVGDGAGARSRVAAVVPHLTGVRVTVITIGPAGRVPAGIDAVVELPWAVDAAQAARGLGAPRTRTRLRAWLAADRPDLLVVDGDSAITATARSAGVATVGVRRPGPTPEAGASVLASPGAGDLAPYPALLEPRGLPRWQRERTVHTGLLSRYAGRRPHRRAGRRALGLAAEAQVVTVVAGRDGLGCAADIAAAAAATPGWTWLTVGRCGSPATGLPRNLHRLGWRDDPWSALEAADVVIGSGALSVVAEVASARRPLLVLPRPGRPDDVGHARVLAEIGAATALPAWLEPGSWERMLVGAVDTDPGTLAHLDDGRGPARAADWLATWATSPPIGAPAGQAARPATDPIRWHAPVGHVVDLTRFDAAASAGRR
ncbi:hypothetical protein [Nitriliruptor alkaliphilus]|uniref:hypothetical protein n=1 Tax=Nitriliruptor alkaliphilus TaxID=427918 RepID=UPI00069641E6|nr:hypothetical protein [Nitriliruptor alkaliphilus]